MVSDRRSHPFDSIDGIFSFSSSQRLYSENPLRGSFPPRPSSHVVHSHYSRTPSVAVHHRTGVQLGRRDDEDVHHHDHVHQDVVVDQDVGHAAAVAVVRVLLLRVVAGTS